MPSLQRGRGRCPELGLTVVAFCRNAYTSRVCGCLADSGVASVSGRRVPVLIVWVSCSRQLVHWHGAKVVLLSGLPDQGEGQKFQGWETLELPHARLLGRLND